MPELTLNAATLSSDDEDGDYVPGEQGWYAVILFHFVSNVVT
jgi:hypothetical protein